MESRLAGCFEHNTCAFPSRGYCAFLGASQEGVSGLARRARHVKTFVLHEGYRAGAVRIPVGEFPGSSTSGENGRKMSDAPGVTRNC